MGLLEVKNVSKRFGGLKALSDVNLSVAENSVHAIIGPHGAGESTLLNCLVGKLIPDAGSVTFDGQSVLGRRPHEINQMGIARVFQTPEIFADLAVIENVLTPCFARRDGSFALNAIASVRAPGDMHERAPAILADLQMLKARDLHAGSLSRGDKRRLEMAMCLVQEPRLLLLDEPYEGLAPVIVNEIERTLGVIKAQGITTVIVEQNAMRAVELADRAVILDTGSVVFDGLAQDVLADDALRSEYSTI